MAKSGALDEISAELRAHCPQCQEMFSDPRVLPCLHTLCMDCLSQLEPFTSMEKGQKRRSLLCPVCDSEVALPAGGVKDFLPDMLAQTEVLRERLRSGGHQMPCDLCADGKGERRCQECKINMCEFCCQAHRRQKRTSAHNLLLLRDLPPGSSLSPAPYCSLHPLEELGLFCEVCAVPSCRDCALLKHHGHELRPVVEVAVKHKEQLRGALIKWDPQLEGLEKTLNAVYRVGEDLRMRADMLREEVEVFTEGYIQAVQEHRLRLLRDIDEEVHRKEQGLNLQKARVHQQLSDLRTATSFTRGLLHCGPDHHIVRAKVLALSRLKDLSHGDRSKAEQVKISIGGPGRSVLEVQGDQYWRSREISIGGPGRSVLEVQGDRYWRSRETSIGGPGRSVLEVQGDQYWRSREIRLHHCRSSDGQMRWDIKETLPPGTILNETLSLHDSFL